MRNHQKRRKSLNAVHIFAAVAQSRSSVHSKCAAASRACANDEQQEMLDYFSLLGHPGHVRAGEQLLSAMY